MKNTIAIIAVSGIATVASAGSTASLNELQPNQPGADPSTQNVELMGAAGSMFSGFIYEIDTDFSPGSSVDRIEAVSGTFDSNGLLVVNISDFENPSATYILASGGSAMIGDGFLPGDFMTQFGTIYDALNSPDAVGDMANSVAGIVGGVDLGFIGSEPILVQRDSITGNWLQVNFAGDVFDAAGSLLGNVTDFADAGYDFNAGSFGAVNFSVVPAPAALAVLGLGGLVATRRRR